MKPRNILGAAITLAIVVVGWLIYHSIDSGRREATIASVDGWVNSDARTKHLVEYVPDIVDAFHDDGESYPDIRRRILVMLSTGSDSDRGAAAAALLFVGVKHRER